jgi:hypothetical protein
MFAVIGVALSLAITPPQVPEPLPPGWEHVVPDGWVWLDHSDRWLLFARSAHQTNHIWVRIENKVQIDGVLSTRTLFEVDCTGRRLRSVQHSMFSRANLADITETFDAPWVWTAAPPGTLGESVVVAACDE